jgi:hypothetical protein
MLEKPIVKQTKLDALQSDPVTFFRFCSLHTPHRPKITVNPVVTPAGTETETMMLFLLRSPTGLWACFFCLLDGEFSNWGYGVEK